MAAAETWSGEGSTRLADYFAVVGYDHQAVKESSSAVASAMGGFQCQGAVLQRFPTNDWKDTPFTRK